MSSYEVVGIDIAARTLAVAGARLDPAARYENTPKGRRQLLAALRRSKHEVRAVMEATGIYFLDLACELAAAGIAVMVVNPKAAHHFAEASLQRRKDDPLDAAMLREYGRRMDFVAWTPPAVARFALRAFGREAQALIKTNAAAKNRLHALTATRLSPAALRRMIERQIKQTRSFSAKSSPRR